MPSLTTLVKQIKTSYPYYFFELGEDFVWRAANQTITHPPLKSPEAIWSLLHELGHAQLQHSHFARDIELMQREVQAWEFASTEIAPLFKIVISSEYIQEHLDTYRIWLDSRSRCPRCNQNGIQTTTNTYSCVNCRCLWQVNDARMCRLRRTRLLDQDRSW